MDPNITPIAALCFFSLIMGIASFWIYRSPWVYGSFFLISYFLASIAKIVTPFALIPLFCLALFHGILKGGIGGKTRALLVMATALLSICMWIHVVPGFHNWKVTDHFVSSKGALPYKFSLNWDKPFTGIFILAWAFPLLRTKEEMKRIFSLSVPYAIFSTILLILIALWGGIVNWEPKFPPDFWLWAIVNLFLVVIPEEALMRGFIQKEFYRLFGEGGFLAASGSILATALLFSLVHVRGMPHFAYLSMVFAAGILYGTIYQYTKSIESSIFCHYALNVTHLLLFTYPALLTQCSNR